MRPAIERAILAGTLDILIVELSHRRRAIMPMNPHPAMKIIRTRNGEPAGSLGTLTGESPMFGKSAFLALAFVASLTAPMKSLAQDAGVSGIPHGPGSIGGVNNSVNDPSGIGNAAKIQPLPSPSMAVPVVPSTAPMVSSRPSPRSMPIVTRVNRGTAILSRREFRRSSAHEAIRPQDKLLDRKLSICRGC